MALLAAGAIFFVVRTGHLGAKLAWGHEEGGGGPPAGAAPRDRGDDSGGGSG